MNSTVFVVDDHLGVGLEIAHELVRVGVQRIGFVSRDAGAGDAAATEIFRSASGVWALSASGDPDSPAEARRMVAELSASLGEPDVLVEVSDAPTAVRAELLQAMRSIGQGIVVDVGSNDEHGSSSGGVAMYSVNGAADAAKVVVARLRS
ncbi:hypothetical protein SAMN05421642_109186 [Rhodococcoides kyotonense]|uniref:Short chain dehydrogenase n=1 Tax=Rhodococcoides kyotonense TaxID=398843 RepID=A0A239K016_9NOCA|nr:hypothetical protein SAMN05421642_109186 [Rhodococcus kyotonensis]